MKILHIAPLNVAGVPFTMADMQRRFGHDARLITLYRNPFGFPEDICLDLPLPRNLLAGIWRAHKKNRASFNRQSNGPANLRPPVDAPRNALESLYFRFDDRRRGPKVRNALEQVQIDRFDVIHFDGGKDLFRDGRLARQWKEQGKKIVCHYLGSDLRVRGVDPIIDPLSDLNLTNESDHLHLHPSIHYIFIPFDASAYEPRPQDNARLRIVHSPSNRAAKGTSQILPVIEKLKKVRNIEFVLIENASHADVIKIKQTCDIAIEQVGNFGGTGYGRNSLETLALGIPTVTEMTADYLAWLPDNPFVLANGETLFDQLVFLVDNPELRREKRRAGRAWVEKYHSYESVHARLMDLYKSHRILS